MIGFNLIQSVTTVAHDMGISPAFAPRKPVDDFLFRFQSVLQLLDNLARLENSNSGEFFSAIMSSRAYNPSPAESEKALYDSKVRDHVREMLRHLQHEDELWVNSHVQRIDDEVRDHPCLEVFLQNHIMEELCTRAKKDRPRLVRPPYSYLTPSQWMSPIGVVNHHKDFESITLPTTSSPNSPQSPLPTDRQRRGTLSEVLSDEEVGAGAEVDPPGLHQ
jgi:hypothetical protein